MPDLSPEDRYQLRKAQMDADKRALEAQKAQQELERLVLELEHQYDLLTAERTIDPRTAIVRGVFSAHKSNGKGIAELLPAAVVEEAAE